MAEKRTEARKLKIRLSTLLLACVLLFCAVTAGTFYAYRKMLNREFDLLVQENLTAYTTSQKREVEQYLDHARGTVKDTALLFSSMDKTPDGEWAQNYLKRVSTENGHVEIVYIPLEQMKGYTTVAEAEMLRMLQTGEGAVSEVQEFKRLNGHFFAVSEPVTRGGEMIGAVRSMLSAEALVQTSQTGYLRQSIKSYIVDGNGDFVSLRNGDGLGGHNLFQEAENQLGMVAALFRKSLATSDTTTAGFDSESEGQMFVSAAGLGYNGWNIVNFASADDVAGYAQNILGYTTIATIGLVLCVILLVLLVLAAVKQQQKKLQRSELRYGLLSRFSDTTLYIYDYQTDVMEWSENARKVLAVKELRMANYIHGNREHELLHQDDIETVRKARKERLPEGVIGYFEARMLDTEGKYRWYGCQHQTLYEHNVATMFVGKLSDISAHKQREERLREQAAVDPLTGLLNASTLFLQVQQCLDEQGYGFFFMIDVDNFKHINDTYGHAVGDAALGSIAETLQQTFREGDLIGRLGGDEFAAFMEGAKDSEAAKNRAGILLGAITSVRVPEAPELRLSVSIGVAGTTGVSTNAKELYAVADHAMYVAKREGKDTYHIAKGILE